MQDLKAKNDVIKKAINEQKQIEFCYKLEGKIRVVNSHCLYVNKLGVTMLDAYQDSGETSTVNQAFKCFVVQHMCSVKLIDKFFWEHNQFNFNSIRYINAISRIGG